MAKTKIRTEIKSKRSPKFTVIKVKGYSKDITISEVDLNHILSISTGENNASTPWINKPIAMGIRKWKIVLKHIKDVEKFIKQYDDKEEN